MTQIIRNFESYLFIDNVQNESSNTLTNKSNLSQNAIESFAGKES